MPQAPIPFVPDQQSGWSALGGAAPVAMNVVVDGRGAVRRRPGIDLEVLLPAFEGLGEGGGALPNTSDIVGVYVALDGALFVVDDHAPGRRIFRRAPEGTSLADLSSETMGGITSPIANKSLPGAGRPIFAETEAMVVIAGGEVPRKVLFSPLGVSPLSGSPPKASHLIANSSRLLGNESFDPELKSLFFYSDQALGSSTTGHETWSGVNTGFITAEARPDPIVAIHETTNEVYVFGQTTLQVYIPDATFVYASLPAMSHGLAAPYSVVQYDQGFAWLNHEKRFVLSGGRQAQYIGEQIQATIDDIEDVSDAFGYHVRLGFLDALVWTFPSDGRTFAYQVGAGWSQWMGWSGDAWSRFIVNAHCLSGSKNIVGLLEGRVGLLNLSTQTDLDEPIRAYVRTGYLDRETDRLKHCTSIRLAMKRGEVTGATAPLAWVRWRDDGGDWSSQLAINVGASGDRYIVEHYRSLGVYRRRQWEFEFSSSVDLELAAVTEEFEILDN